MPDIRNVFISHRFEDETHVEGLKTLLDGHGVAIRNSSVTSSTPNNATNDDYIKQILRDRILWAGTVVVLITPDTRNHEWVDWEIEYANHLGKRIVGVWAPGSAECDLPDALDRHADAVVGWNSAAIVAALDGHDNWQTPAGDPRGAQPINRIRC